MELAHTLEQFRVLVGYHAEYRLQIRLMEQDEGKLNKLLKHLRIKEMMQFHPDQINKRTGIAGVVNQGDEKGERVVLARTAVQELVEVVEVVGKWLKKMR
jgi:hypothetical protein